MNRKLHNTSIALSTSAAVLILGLATGMPTAPSRAVPGSEYEAALAEAVLDAEFAARSAEAAAASAGTTGVDAVLDNVRRARGARRSRQSMVMPYFSFAPRG